MKMCNKNSEDELPEEQHHAEHLCKCHRAFLERQTAALEEIAKSLEIIAIRRLLDESTYPVFWIEYPLPVKVAEMAKQYCEYIIKKHENEIKHNEN